MAAATDANLLVIPPPETVDKPSEPDRPLKARKRKRARNVGIELTAVRPAKKQRLLKRNGISVPWNDGAKYDEAVQNLRIFPIPPLADTLMEYATRKGLLNIVLLGIACTNMIEKLVADQEGIWQVPKVTVEFKRIGYKRKEQPYTKWSREVDAPPVSPSTIPVVQETAPPEDNDVIDNGEATVATNDEHKPDSRRETEIVRSPCEDV